MCRTQHYISTTCAHSWFEILESCKKETNFSTCPSFKDGRLRGLKPPGIRLPRKCPECDLGGKYDGDTVRMVEKIMIGKQGKNGEMIEKEGGRREVTVVWCLIM